MDEELCRMIQTLSHLSVSALRTKYRDLLGEEAKKTHKQSLVRRIAWYMQALAGGDLSERARSRAAAIVDQSYLVLHLPQQPLAAIDSDALSVAPGRDTRLPPPGSMLRRSYQGRDIVVKVLGRGFEYETKHYGSLSAIARQVTGTRWNGLLFFRLAERRHG